MTGRKLFLLSPVIQSMLPKPAAAAASEKRITLVKVSHSS